MITNDLGALVESFRFESLPDDVVLAAKMRLLDFFAISMAGYQLGRVEPILPVYTGSGPCTVLGYGKKADPRSAAVLNGFMAHSTWYDDGSRITGGHPSTSIFPALLALAEQRGSSGSDILLAAVSGYEVFNRIGIVLYPATVRHGFLPTGILSPIASATACAKLLRLPEGGIARAISIATPLGAGLKSAFKGGDAQPIQIGRGTEAGLVAALMAEQGLKGYAGNLDAFLIAHDTNKGMSVSCEPAGDYQIKNTYIKIHGGCRGNHAPLDVVFSLIKANGIAAENVANVEVTVDTVTAANEIHHPKNRDDAQFNIAFCVAIALLRGNALLPTFSDENVAAADVREFMERVSIIVDPQLDRLLPDKRGAAVRFIMKDGTEYSGFTDIPEGEPERPLTFDRVCDKFVSLSKDVIGSKTDTVLALTERLETLSDIAPLMSALCRA